MAFVIAILTLILVVDCAVLIFLVLLQLPKKEAGAGLAFGAGATDALFGAGSGNVLTKITKYAATIFFVVAIFLALFQSRRSSSSDFQKRLQNSTAVPTMPSQTPAPTTPPATSPPAEATNVPAPAAPVTPAPAAPATGTNASK